MAVVPVEPIVDGDNLLRRVHPSQVVDDKNLGTKRPSSGAFTDTELSADSELLLAKYGLDLSFCLKAYAGYSLVRFAVQFARSNGMVVTHTPKEDNPAHTDVTGKKSKALQRQFAAASEWAHEAPNKA
jgi:hypothetical protein